MKRPEYNTNEAYNIGYEDGYKQALSDFKKAETNTTSLCNNQKSGYPGALVGEYYWDIVGGSLIDD